MGTEIDQALAAILERTKFGGGLPTTIADAEAFAGAAGRYGIDGALRRAREGQGAYSATEEKLEQLAEVFRAEVEQDPPDLDEITVGALAFEELRDLAKDLKIRGWSRMKHETLVQAITEKRAEMAEAEAEG